MSYRPEIRWGNLLQYELSIRHLTQGAMPPFSLRSFANLSTRPPDPAPSPVGAVMRDGFRMMYRYYPAPADCKVHFVFVHGSACFGDQFHTMAVHLSSSEQAHVYTLNLRGHGLSGGERGHAVDYPTQLCDDLEDFLSDLRRRQPDAHIVLCGHSAGGGLVLAASQTRIDNYVDKYIFLAPMVAVDSRINRPFFGGWVARVHAWRIRLLAVLNLLGISAWNDCTVITFNPISHQHDARFVQSWSLNTALAFGPGPKMKRFQTIAKNKSVLVLSGHADECYFTSMYGDAFRTLAPHAQVLDVGPNGHFDLFEDSQSFQTIKSFLALV